MAISLNASSFSLCFGASFYFKLEASGGAGESYSYSIVSGGLPPSVILSGDTLLGVTTKAGVFYAEVLVVNSSSEEAYFTLEFVVRDPLTLESGVLPVTPSEPYAQQLVIEGLLPGQGTITFDPGLLPDGLSFDSGTNTISGTTSVQSGVYPIAASLSHGGCENTYSFSLIVYKLEIDPVSLCVFPNVPYYAKLFTLNGISPFTWEVVGDPLPDYLTLNTLTGEITGSAATETVTYTSVRVTDGLGSVATTNVTITVSTICNEIAGTTGSVGVAYPVAPGRAPWIPSLQSARMVVGSGYFEDNLIKYLPTMYGI
jgi:hypothetical protein